MKIISQLALSQIKLNKKRTMAGIFAASANKRIQEFGILKCVGGTRKQIKASVIYESMWISIIAIPLGLILGTLIGYIGVRITGHFISDLNNVAQSIIMRPFSFSLPFYVSIWTYLFAAVFSFLIVLCSAYKPAKAVGKLTAIQCVKGVGAGTDIKDVEVKNSLAEKIFGCEGAIAYRNIKRNKFGYKATIRALSLGILLLLLTGGLAGQAKDFQECMNPHSKEMMVDYCSIRDYELNKDTGKEEEKIVAPIPAATYNEITEKLSEYGTSVYGVGSDACTYHALLDIDVLSEEMLQAPDIFDENQEDLKEQGFQEVNPYPVRLVVPDIDARSFDWFNTPEDEQAYTEYAWKIMDEYYPILTEDSYVEQGYTVSIARTDTMAKMLNIAIVLAQIVMYGFVILLVFMGFTSVISTLATNIRIRSREFAILKSVGMTNASLYKMLYCESVICIIKAFIPGIILGIAIPFAINLSIRKAFPVLYHVPWVVLVAGIVVLPVIVMIITHAEISKLKNKSIIDEIRMDIM